MPVDTDLAKLHRRPINVWVEDALTSEYLSETWREPRALFLIGGSGDGVRPAVQNAWRSGLGNVFGVVDKDFEATNHATWGNPNKRIFVLPVHEMENFLLDAVSLFSCDVHNQHRSAAQIEQRMHARAQSLLLWMTACHVIKRLRRTCWDDFIGRPAVAALHALPDVFTYIQATPWYQQFPANSASINSAAAVQGWINDVHAQFTADLANGNWRRTFSGKEIARDVRGYIYQPPPHAVNLSEYDIDLAKSVARWQKDNGHVPVEVGELLAQVRQKSGL